MPKRFTGFRHQQLAALLAALLSLFFLGPTDTYGQVSEAQARILLAERGIPEDTLRARLLRKGLDPDSIRPDNLQFFQNEILGVIRDYEAERAGSSLLGDTLFTPPPTGMKAVQKKNLPVRPVPDLPKDTLQQPLFRYGQTIFNNKSIEVFQRADDLVPPESYVLGAGDKLGIVGFGRSQFSHILLIDGNGFVKPEGMARILLRGLTLGEARTVLFQRYSQAYLITRDEFQVSLQQVRLMTVNVFGEVVTPGSYTLPAINTAFNALAAAGGPTAAGSVREIRIIRGDKTIPVDVYAFMAKPGAAPDFFLQDNDYLHIPVARKVVEIRGAVLRPMAYELLDGENLARLLDYAGGAQANAYLADVQVTRYLQDRRVVASVNLRDLVATGGDYILLNGDVVTVKAVEDQVENIVKVSGAVSFPGEYAWREDFRALDLLNQSVLRPDARLDFAYVLRYNADGTFKYAFLNLEAALAQPFGEANLRLFRGDQLEILSQKSFAAPDRFSVTGAVHTPQIFDFNPSGGVRVRDAVMMAGGLLPDAAASAYIFRRDPAEPKTVAYIPVDLARAVEDPASGANVQIQSGDQLRVFNKSLRRDELKVSIFGAVRNPGDFDFGKGMTLADLVNLAGGFTYDADYDRIDVARPNYEPGQSLKMNLISTSLAGGAEQAINEDKSLPLAPFDHVYVRSIPEYELQQTVQVDGEVKYPGTYAILKDKERLSDLLIRAGGLNGRAFPEGARLIRKSDSIGLVVIDLIEVLRNPRSTSNIVLLDGDIIQIPKSRDLVTLSGFVNLTDAYSQDFLTGERSVSVAFRGPRSAKYYINEFAAGVSDQGSKARIRVQYADGRVQKTGGFLFRNYPKVERGATVYVGPKKQKPAKVKSDRKVDWAVTLRDTLAATTAIITILVLVDQLSK